MKTKLLVFISLLLLTSVSACKKSGRPNNHSISSNGNESETSESSDPDVIHDDSITLDSYREAIESSKPTKIVTNMTYDVPNSNTKLHFYSSLVIEYGSMVKTSYSYSYEKLNEIVTGNEEMISTVVGTLYSNGSSIYDGVQWVNSVEKTTIVSSVDLNENYASLDIIDGVLKGSVINSKAERFFGHDYGVTDVVFELSLNKDYFLHKLKLDCTGYVETLRQEAPVHLETLYTYNAETVELPQ